LRLDLDNQIAQAHTRRDTANSLVLRAARQVGMESGILKGPGDSLWVIRDGRVAQVHAKHWTALCGDVERTPSGLPVIPEEFNPTPEAEELATVRAPYREVIVKDLVSS
jgi:hypothetical protein